jgi:hypothetical protein
VRAPLCRRKQDHKAITFAVLPFSPYWILLALGTRLFGQQSPLADQLLAAKSRIVEVHCLRRLWLPASRPSSWAQDERLS